VAKHRITGNLVSDAHLAAIALENDATLYTADRDFARFSAWRVINPLV
jgi:predicted nucleic acid-binding protein